MIGQWISACEQLPLENQQVLAVYDTPAGREICTCRYQNTFNGPNWYQATYNGLIRPLKIHVSHWMPLPVLPGMTQNVTDDVVWPHRDKPYREDMKFIEGNGQVVLDGKVYYPTLLRLKLKRKAVLAHIHQLLISYEDFPDSSLVEIYLSGEIQEVEE